MNYLKISLLSLFFLFQIALIQAKNGDDIIYLNNQMEVVKKKGKASYYSQMEAEKEGTYLFKVYFMSGELKMEGYYKDEEMQVPNGEFVYYYKSGQVESKGNYKNGVKTGVWQRYNKHGKELPERVYGGYTISDIVHTTVDEMPEFIGGDEALGVYIQENLNYPPLALKENQEGIVEVLFIVNAEGEIENAHIYAGVHPLLDAEAIRIVRNMPSWKPGVKNGDTVNVEMRLPVEFNIE